MIEDFIINGPVGQLQCLYSTGLNVKQPRATVVICHPHPLYGGTMNNKVVHIINKTFHHAGFNTLRFNFRGVEKSSGTHDHGVGEVDDLMAIVDWLRSQKNVDLIYLAGFSFGAYIATQAVNLSQAQRLLLVAPPVSMYDFSAIHINVPTLVIQGGQDTVVEPQQVRSWVEQQQTTTDYDCQLHWIESAEHFFHGKLNLLRDAIVTHWAEEME